MLLLRLLNCSCARGSEKYHFPSCNPTARRWPYRPSGCNFNYAVTFSL